MNVDWHSESLYNLETALYFLGLIFYVIAAMLYIKMIFVYKSISIHPLISLMMAGSFLGLGIFIVWFSTKICEY